MLPTAFELRSERLTDLNIQIDRVKPGGRVRPGAKVGGDRAVELAAGEHASEELWTERELVLRVQGFDNADPEAARAAVAQDSKALDHIPEPLRAELLPAVKEELLALLVEESKKP